MAARRQDAAGRRENVMNGKSLAYGQGESYSGIVPTKRPNQGGRPLAEAAEGRPLTKENTPQPNPCQTQRWESGPSGLERVRPRFDAKPSSIRGKNRVR